MSVETNEWREQSFDQVMSEPEAALANLDREIELLGEDIRGITMMIGARTDRIAALRRQVADIARTLP